MDLQNITRETIEKVSAGILQGTKDGSLRKAIDTTTGIKGYGLEGPVLQLVPLLTALRASIPRRVKAGTDSVRNRYITALSQPKPTIAKDAAGPLFTTTTEERVYSYKVMGLRGQVGRDAEAEAQGFDSALAIETTNCLLGQQKLEEIYVIGGNITALAAPAGHVAAERDAKGTIANVTLYVQIAAITIPAYNRTAVDMPLDYDGTDALLAGRSVLAADIDVTATGDGVGPLSTEINTGAMTGTDNGVKITWTPVPKAGAYLIYAGTTTGAANLKLNAIVTQTSITLSSLATGGVAASTHVATSADALAWDGILATSVDNGGYVKYVNGKLTGSNGEVLEIQDAFAYLWRRSKVGRFRILVSGDESRILTRLGIAQNIMNIVVGSSADGRTQIVMGGHVGEIINSVSSQRCPVEVMPWLPPGTVLILPMEVPYNNANISAPFDMIFAHDAERWDYYPTPTTGRVYGFDITEEGVLRNRFPAGCGVLTNIFKG